MDVIHSPILQSHDIVHGFFTNRGGVSVGPYTSLNVSPQRDDYNCVETNRNICVMYLGGGRLVLMNQIHSARVVQISTPVGFLCDGMVTKTSGLLLGVVTADCAPVLFSDSKNRVIGACHAGWRGALSGVVRNTLREMIDLGAEISHIDVVIGPTISKSSYEVSADFPGLTTKIGTSYYFDLPGWITNYLETVGVCSISNVEEDTFTNPNRFFSYRYASHYYSSKETGRQLSVIGLR